MPLREKQISVVSEKRHSALFLNFDVEDRVLRPLDELKELAEWNGRNHYVVAVSLYIMPQLVSVV